MNSPLTDGGARSACFTAVRNEDVIALHALITRWRYLANVPDGCGQKPLIYGVKTGNPAIVRKLMESHARLDATDMWGRSPLDIAVERKDTTMVETLLRYYEQQGRVPEATALLRACELNHQAMIALLLNAGAPPMLGLHHVVDHGKIPILRQCIDHGVPLDPALVPRAIFHGQADLLDVLLETGINAETRDDQGRTPLHLAALLGDRLSARHLLAAGVWLDPQDHVGNTPLSLAKTPRIANVLRRDGCGNADPNA